MLYHDVKKLNTAYDHPLLTDMHNPEIAYQQEF